MVPVPGGQPNRALPVELLPLWVEQHGPLQGMHAHM